MRKELNEIFAEMMNAGNGKDLFKVLTRIQNLPKNQNKDIMTMAGFSKNIEELFEYVKGEYFEMVKAA
jgi:hypothetical protein